MSATKPPQYNEEFWRKFIVEGDPRELAMRRVFGAIPHGPRCNLCLAPFGGVGAPVMRMIGKPPSRQNPRVCASCFTFMMQQRGGAEVTAAFMFADVRGSTTLAEKMSPAEFRALMDRFYDVASNAIFERDGILDKFVGDEAIGFWGRGIGGERYVAKAVEAARALLLATGHGEPGGPWLPVGVGVHHGPAWIGAVGEGSHQVMTALGDAVNVTARLVAAAAAGEIVVSTDALAAAGLDPALERRQLDVKGKHAPIEVVTLTVGASAPTTVG